MQEPCITSWASPDFAALGGRYLGDDRFQMALQVGLGMNMMSGDQFKRQQEAGGPTASGSSAPASDPKPAPRPKQV